MSSSSGDDYRSNWRSFPLHDAAEAGDMEALTRILRPPKRASGSAMEEDGSGADDGGAKRDGEAEGQNEKDNNGITNNHTDDNDDDDDDDYRPPVDLEERDPEGATPLHVALLAKQLDAARLLLESGAGTTKRLEGSTAAHIALSVASIRRHHSFADAALKLLLKHHQDISVKDDRGQTLLHLAASLGLDDAIKTLLTTPGGKELLNVKERLHSRPLHLAALGGHVSAVEALLAAGCEKSFSNLHGNTALHLACSKARWAVARLLLDRGDADVTATNKNKQRSGEVALKQGLFIPDSLPELQPPGGTAGKSINGVATNVADVKSNKTDSTAPLSSKGPETNGVWNWEFPAAGEGKQENGPPARTAVLHHPICLQHHSCPPIRRSSNDDPPPENVKRLEVIYNEDSGVLRADEFASLDWDSKPSRAQLTDVLRVHDYHYVQKLERLCMTIPENPSDLRQLDGDTAVSRSSFEAAMHAAGSVCDAVDRVMTGRNRNAFCAVRPPGHHAGPRGLVTCGNDAQGSHGFCLLNNVAIGAAYARCVHRHTGVDRVAIVDFDVHHGNGTEEIVKSLVPRMEKFKINAPFCSGVLQELTYSPWLNPEDPDKCLFVSVHGYGKKERGYPMMGGWFYPGSGATTDCPIPSAAPHTHGGEAHEGVDGDAAAAAAVVAGAEGCKQGGLRNGEGDRERVSPPPPGVDSAADREPLVLDVGIPLPEHDDTPGASRHRWRDVYRNDILPKLAAFNPDIIMVSAGFDAHKKDSINFGYIGLLEEDYEWVTQQLVQVANKCCKGRLVSVLEGGYRIQGGIVSAFGRSVAGHVRALVDGCESRQEWNEADAAWESQFEQRLLEERERKRKLRLEQQLQAMRDRENQLKITMMQPHHQAEASGDAAAVPAGENQPDIAAPAAEEGGKALPTEEENPLPSKRRRFDVDYVALQKRLQDEESPRPSAADDAPPPTSGTDA